MSGINRIFDDFDALVSPVTGLRRRRWASLAGKGALRTLVGVGREYPYTPPWNYTGQPAALDPAPSRDARRHASRFPDRRAAQSRGPAAVPVGPARSRDRMARSDTRGDSEMKAVAVGPELNLEVREVPDRRARRG